MLKQRKISNILQVRSGFTLLEIIVVIVILAILIAALIPSVSGSQARARDTARTADLQEVAGALESYNADYGGYPVAQFGGVGSQEEGLPSQENLTQYFNPFGISHMLMPRTYAKEIEKLSSGLNIDRGGCGAEEAPTLQQENSRIGDIDMAQEQGGGLRINRARDDAAGLALRSNCGRGSTLGFLQDDLKDYIALLPKDPNNRGAAASIDGYCQKLGHDYAYFSDRADRQFFAITSTKESKRGNTTNCNGIIDTEAGSFHVIGKKLRDIRPTGETFQGNHTTPNAPQPPRTEMIKPPINLDPADPGPRDPQDPSNPGGGTIPLDPSNPGTPRPEGEECFVIVDHTIVDYASNCITKDVYIANHINGQGVSAIGPSAFYNKGLESVSFAYPSAITSIGTAAFANNALTSFEIPITVTHLSDGMLRNNNLTDLMVNTRVSVGENVVTNNGLNGNSDSAINGPGEWYVDTNNHWTTGEEPTIDSGPLDIVLKVDITSANQTLKLNKYFNVTDYEVDRGDGSSDILSTDKTHTYSAPGVYYVILKNPGERWKFAGSDNALVPKAGTTANNVEIVYMPSLADGFGESETAPGNNFFRSFNRNGSLTSLPEGSFDTSSVVTAGSNFFQSFNQNGSLTSLPEGSFDTSNITEVESYFFQSFNQNGSLTSLPSGSFDTSNIISTEYGFFSSFNRNGSLTSLPSGSFDTSSVVTAGINFFESFNSNGALTSLPEGSFDTSNITTVGASFFSLFNQNGALTSLPSGSFDTSNITTVGANFFHSFNRDGSLTSLPKGSFDTSNITNAGGGFFNSFNRDGALTSLPSRSFDTSNITTVGNYSFDYFNQGGALTKAPRGVKIKNVTNGDVTFHYNDNGNKSESVSAGQYFEGYASGR